MNNFNSAFKPKDVKLVNYNATRYENQKMNNIVDNKMNMFGRMNSMPNQDNKPVITNTVSYSGNAIEKEREVKSKVDSLNRMNNGFRNN